MQDLAQRLQGSMVPVPESGRSESAMGIYVTQPLDSDCSDGSDGTLPEQVSHSFRLPSSAADPVQQQQSGLLRIGSG